MGDRNDCRVALLPIKPQFVQRILAGSKKVEFRRRFASKGVEHIVIYASSPVKRVVGFFRVGARVTHRPEQIWKRYAAVGGISHAEFTAYYRGTDEAIAIEVVDLFILRSPASLRELRLADRPPQNFCYVDRAVFSRLRKRSRQSAA